MGSYNDAAAAAARINPKLQDAAQDEESYPTDFLGANEWKAARIYLLAGQLILQSRSLLSHSNQLIAESEARLLRMHFIKAAERQADDDAAADDAPPCFDG